MAFGTPTYLRFLLISKSILQYNQGAEQSVNHPNGYFDLVQDWRV